MAENVVTLEGVLSIAKAEALHHELEDAFREAQVTRIEAKEVERVDTSVMQTLVSFVVAMKEANVQVTWGEVSEEFLAAAQLLGVKPFLALE